MFLVRFNSIMPQRNFQRKHLSVSEKAPFYCHESIFTFQREHLSIEKRAPLLWLWNIVDWRVLPLVGSKACGILLKYVSMPFIFHTDLLAHIRFFVVTLQRIVGMEAAGMFTAADSGTTIGISIWKSR